MDPIAEARCQTCPLGSIDQCESLQPEIPTTWVTLEDKNVPLNQPQTWGV